MTLYGRLVKNTAPLKDATVTRDAEAHGESFAKCLEECLRMMCRELGIPIPLWLKKNTKEFGRFHRTFFPADQFIDKVDFDRFELTLEE